MCPTQGSQLGPAQARFVEHGDDFIVAFPSRRFELAFLAGDPGFQMILD